MLRNSTRYQVLMLMFVVTVTDTQTGQVRVYFNEQGHPASAITEDRTQDVLAVDAALEKLAVVDPQAERIVEMRFYAGMTEAEIAEVLNVSDRWVRKQWAFARAWLRRELQAG